MIERSRVRIPAGTAGEFLICQMTSEDIKHQLIIINKKKKACQKTLFLLSQLQHIINIDTRIETLLQRSLKTSHSRLCVSSVGWLWRRTLKPIELPTSKGKLILPDPSLSTKKKMSALGILNLPQQLIDNKGICMHKVLNNNSRNYLANSSLVTSPTTPTPGIISSCQG